MLGDYAVLTLPQVLTDVQKDEREARAIKQAAAFSTTGWDTDDEDEMLPDVPPVVEKLVEMLKGVPVRRWDVDNKNCLWPVVRASCRDAMVASY